MLWGKAMGHKWEEMLGGRGDFKQHVQSSHVEEDLREWRMTWEHRGRGNSMNKGPLVGTWQLREAAKRWQRVETDVTWKEGKEDSPSRISHWDFSLCWMSEMRSFWKGLVVRQHACPHACPPLTERALHLAPSPGT